MKQKIKTFQSLINETIKEFGDDHATKLSASLAYFTLFSIAPLLLVIIHIINFIYSEKNAEGQVIKQIEAFVGTESAHQLEVVLKNMNATSGSTLFGIIGIVVFIYSATSIFTEIKSSINHMWSIRARPRRGWLKIVTDRLLALVFIAGVGVLMIASLILNVVVDAITSRLQDFHYLHDYLGNVNVAMIAIINTAALFIIVTIMFAVLFKVLPDANIKWKDILVGASFTGVLFIIGKLLITWYLSSSRLISAYGAAASLIILLSWIYYSALIVYFGAEFTEVYARRCGSGVSVRKTAVFVFKREARELTGMKIHTGEDLGSDD